MTQESENNERKGRSRGFRGDTSFEEGLNDPFTTEQVVDTDAPQPVEEPESDPFASDDENMSPRRPSLVVRLFNEIISGNILSSYEVRRRYPYMLFIAFLMLMYIANVFKMQQLHRAEIQLQRQVKELRAKSLTLTSNRMELTRQSSIVRMIGERGLGLEEALAPPKVITEK